MNAHPIGRRLLADAAHYHAPTLCAGCSDPVAPGGSLLCEGCRSSIETAPYPEEIYNSLLEVEAGPSDIELEAVGSLYLFSPGGPIRDVIHAIKYRGCRPLAIELGLETGLTLSVFPEFRDVSLVVPIPLHPARLRERGYNQAGMVGRGIAHGMDVPVEERAMMRRRHTGTQTALDNRARRRNVEGAFQARREFCRDQVVLLCDDVLTTGATLRSAARALLEAGASAVVGATLAFDDIVEQKEAVQFSIPIP